MLSLKIRSLILTMMIVWIASACHQHQCPTYMTEDQVKEMNEKSMGKKNKKGLITKKNHSNRLR